RTSVVVRPLERARVPQPGHPTRVAVVSTSCQSSPCSSTAARSTKPSRPNTATAPLPSISTRGLPPFSQLANRKNDEAPGLVPLPMVGRPDRSRSPLHRLEPLIHYYLWRSLRDHSRSGNIVGRRAGRRRAPPWSGHGRTNRPPLQRPLGSG